MNPILTYLLLFTLLYLIGDIFLKQSTIGLFLNDIQNSLFGNTEEYLDPMSQALFLEFIHMEIFFVMMILLTLGAIYIRLHHQKPYLFFIINSMMLTSLLSIVSISLAYFYLKSFISLYIVSFFLWHILALYMTLSSLWILQRD